MEVVVAVTVMRVLLFVLHVCMLRECDGYGNAHVVAVSESMGDIRGSGFVSTADDVL